MRADQKSSRPVRLSNRARKRRASWRGQKRVILGSFEAATTGCFTASAPTIRLTARTAPTTGLPTCPAPGNRAIGQMVRRKSAASAGSIGAGRSEPSGLDVVEQPSSSDISLNPQTVPIRGSARILGGRRHGRNSPMVVFRHRRAFILRAVFDLFARRTPPTGDAEAPRGGRDAQTPSARMIDHQRRWTDLRLR